MDGNGVLWFTMVIPLFLMMVKSDLMMLTVTIVKSNPILLNAIPNLVTFHLYHPPSNTVRYR
jgi:hypothetical protein